MDELLERVPGEEQIIVEAEFNGHVGEGNQEDEDVMEKHKICQ